MHPRTFALAIPHTTGRLPSAWTTLTPDDSMPHFPATTGSLSCHFSEVIPGHPSKIPTPSTHIIPSNGLPFFQCKDLIYPHVTYSVVYFVLPVPISPI